MYINGKSEFTFIGTGKFNNEDIEICFKTNRVITDWGDRKENPKIIIEPLLDEESKTYYAFKTNIDKGEDNMKASEILEKVLMYKKLNDKNGCVKFLDNLSEDELNELKTYLENLTKICESRLFLRSLPDIFN